MNIMYYSKPIDKNLFKIFCTKNINLTHFFPVAYYKYRILCTFVYDAISGCKL